jgi:hypothetical protein
LRLKGVVNDLVLLMVKQVLKHPACGFYFIDNLLACPEYKKVKSIKYQL